MQKILEAIAAHPKTAFALAAGAAVLSVILFGPDRTWEAIVGIYNDAVGSGE